MCKAPTKDEEIVVAAITSGAAATADSIFSVLCTQER